MKQQILIHVTPDELKKLIDESVTNAIHQLVPAKKTPDKEIMDRKEVAKFLGVAEATIYSRTHKKSIPHYKKGGRLYFKKTEIEAYRDSGKQLTQDEFNDLASQKISY